MKKFTLFVVVFFAAVSFVSCSKDDGSGGISPVSDGTVSGRIVNLSAAGVGVGVGVGELTLDGYFDMNWSATPDVSVPVSSNGTFTFDLPTPSAAMLYPISYSVSTDMYGTVPPGIRISDTGVLCTSIGLRVAGYSVWYGSTGNTTSQGMSFLYVDNDVTISGRTSLGDLPLSLNLNLKKGWNKTLTVARVISPTAIQLTLRTGSIPSNMVWRIEVDNSFDD